MPLSQDYNLNVIYEDKFILVINKPPGIVVNNAQSVKSPTIQDILIKNSDTHNKLPSDNPFTARQGLDVHNKLSSVDPFISRQGIVHRLDKDTSGLLMVAKENDVFINLQNQFKERTIEKKYLTLVHGKVVPKNFEIKASVGRLPWNRERFGIIAGGKEAVTAINVLKYYSNQYGIYSYLEACPHTGRTHQIRIHLKYIGHGIVSDEFYTGRKTYRKDLLFCPRLFLHAAFIAFNHPVSKKRIELKTDLPEDLKRVLAQMNTV